MHIHIKNSKITKRLLNESYSLWTQYENGSFDWVYKLSDEEVKTEYASYIKDYFQRIENINEDFENFWNINEKNIKSFYTKIQKDDDVILSACPYCLLSIMTNRLGIKNVIL